MKGDGASRLAAGRRAARPKWAPKIRRARPSDLANIITLERACFEDYRLASAASLRRSITSKHQSFWVVENPKGGLWALLVLWHFPNLTRVYDVATHPEARGHGIGRMLMAHAEGLARKKGCTVMSLEAEEADQRLVDWYLGQGYSIVDRLEGFYHNGCHAVRMRKSLEG